MCSSLPHADSGCVQGKCACLLGYDDCTAEPGCETPTSSDPKNCGACGHACAQGECVGGDCSVRVFVTSQAFDGKLGDVAGADAVCQGLAQAASLKGKFVAWLSSDTTSATTRVAHSQAPYRRLDGEIVAQSWAALSKKFVLDKPISVDETGNSVTDAYAWTGTDFNGTATRLDCEKWSFNGHSDTAPIRGQVGSVTSPSAWLTSTQLNCDEKARLFCFEVPE
jgi:hypothetical protein